jgi:hypothetical protein
MTSLQHGLSNARTESVNTRMHAPSLNSCNLCTDFDAVRTSICRCSHDWQAAREVQKASSAP